MANRAVWQKQPVVGIVPAGLLDGMAEVLFGAREVLGMKGPAPALVVARAIVARQTVELVHPVVPDEPSRRDVVLPDADLGGVERKAEPSRQAVELALPAPQLEDVPAPLLDEPAGHHHRHHDEAACEHHRQPQQPDERRRFVPPVLRYRSNTPASRRELDIGDHRVVGEDTGTPVEDLAIAPGRIAPGDGDLDRKSGIK